MGWINLIVGACALNNIAKSYVNAANAIAIFIEPTP